MSTNPVELLSDKACDVAYFLRCAMCSMRNGSVRAAYINLGRAYATAESMSWKDPAKARACELHEAAWVALDLAADALGVTP